MNINKIFPEEDKNKKKRASEFVQKHGFLVVLAVCILIIGASVAYVAMDNFAGSEFSLENPIVESPIPEKEDSGVESSANDQEKIGATSMPTATAKAVTANDATPIVTPKAPVTPMPKASVKAKLKQNLMMPVFGQICSDYAMERLIYSKTLKDWRTHNGVDIAADRGTLVKAAADGVISDIKNDPGLGVTVIIDHGGGYKTLYANLSAGDMVAVNQIVKQGENIGSVGNTAIFESSEQSHLHFGVLELGETVDPSKFLPKIN